jgi:trigger factor
MNISKTNKDELNATITLKITPEDYKESVEKELSNYRKKAQIKGFRPGKAPLALVKRMVGTHLITQEIDKLVSESLNKFLSDEKLHLLGQPIPSESQQPVDLENETEHEFLFDVGLAPTVEIIVDNKIQIPFYKIKVDKEMIDQEIDRHTKQYAKAQTGDTVEVNSYVRGDIVQIDKKGKLVENGISVENTLISIDVIKDEKEKAKFVGKKINDTIDFDIKKAYPNNLEIAGILKTEKNLVDDLEPWFQFTPTDITIYTPAEINQEFFDKLYGEGVVNSEEEYREKISNEFERFYDTESEFRFGIDAREKLLNTVQVPLPGEFLKRWLKMSDREGKITDEVLEKEYPEFEKDTQWQLIKGSIVEKQEFKVNEEEVRNEARLFTENQFVQYGLPLNAISEEHMKSFIDKNLEKEDDRHRFAERVVEKKVIKFLMENVKLTRKTLSFDDFKKLYEQK